jgi:hypothetical protein
MLAMMTASPARPITPMLQDFTADPEGAAALTSGAAMANSSLTLHSTSLRPHLAMPLTGWPLTGWAGALTFQSCPM